MLAAARIQKKHIIKERIDPQPNYTPPTGSRFEEPKYLKKGLGYERYRLQRLQVWLVG